MDGRKRYETIKRIGTLLFFGCGGIVIFCDVQALPGAFVMLPGTVLLGVAAVLHKRLPAKEKDKVEISFYGIFHIYMTFLTAAVLNVSFFLKAAEGRSGTAKSLSTILLFAFLGLVIITQIYSDWYYYTDQEKKRRRREYHRKRHGK